MTEAERRRRVEDICDDALQLKESDRAAFVASACGGDEALRQEVEALLSHARQAEEFLATPIGAVAADVLTDERPSLVGRHIGVYQILSLLGAGGMGHVYRARDTKLRRDVAIKVLPHIFTRDRDRLARFEREAQVLASINHPNIAAIYGVHEEAGVNAIILELVEGDTLADRVRRGPIPAPECMALARQMAGALEAAHAKGIVHRDLKPANIKVTPNGVIKVLDFGLAKVADQDRPDGADDLTVTTIGTRAGLILGTAGYMSPEQARGAVVDKRTDIWAFGCVLFEMLTGTQAFPGVTASDSIAAILARAPEWKALPATVSPEVRRLLERCLEKDPQQRLRDIGEAEIVLDRDRRTPARRGGSPTLMVAATALLAAIATVVLFYRLRAVPPPPPETPVALTDFGDSAIAPAISSDGRMLTFIRGGAFGDSAVRGQVYVKMLPNGEPVPLTRDQYNKEQPVFSPDGSRIVYTSMEPGGFKWDSWEVPVLGGSPRPFLPNASGLVWLDDQRLMYSEVMTGVHMGIVTSTPNGADHRAIYWPALEGGMAHRSARSPDGKSLLIVEMDGFGWLPCRLLPFDGSSTGRPVGPQEAQCTTAGWSHDGRYMYFSSNSGGGWHIWRQRFPDGVPEQVTMGPLEQEGVAFTPDGKFLITSMGSQQGTIWLNDAEGQRQLTSEGFAMLPTMSPLRDRVFYLVRNAGGRAYASGALWSIDLKTGERRRELPDRIVGSYAISPDARRVVFTSVDSPETDGVWIADLYRRTAPRQLTHGAEFRAMFGAPGEIVYMSQGSTRHLYRMNEDGSDKRQISETAVNNLIDVSPDGDWAVALLPQAAGGGTSVGFISTRGQPTLRACQDGCSLGFGPNRVQSTPFKFSADGTSLFVALQYYGARTRKTAILPYRSGVPLDRLWPKGLGYEQDIPNNPGARVVNEADIFPATAESYFIWRRSTQSNLYRLPVSQ